MLSHCLAMHKTRKKKKASGANRERLLWERPICSLAHDDLSRYSVENLFNQHFDSNRHSVWLNEVLICIYILPLLLHGIISYNVVHGPTHVLTLTICTAVAHILPELDQFVANMWSHLRIIDPHVKGLLWSDMPYCISRYERYEETDCRRKCFRWSLAAVYTLEILL